MDNAIYIEGKDLKLDLETFSSGYNDSTIPSKTHTRVDLSAFKLPTAKIDCLKFEFRPDESSAELLTQYNSELTTGRLETPKDFRDSRHTGRLWVTLHDPSLPDLNRLIRYFPKARITYLEVAVDFHLPDDCWELDRLELLARQLRHCMYPQQQPHLSKARRKYYNLAKKRYFYDGLGTPYKGTQVLWEDDRYSQKMALYIKRYDNGHAVNKPWVRIEAKFHSTGLFHLGLEEVTDLLTFADPMRKLLKPMFYVAKGFNDRRSLTRKRGLPTNPWARWGAQLATRHPYTLMPDSVVHMAIGKALGRLRESLLRLRHRSA